MTTTALSPLNNQQQDFVSAYLLTGNATEAAIEAGYSKRTAYSQGSRLLKHVAVASAIHAGMVREYSGNSLTVEWVLDGLAAEASDNTNKASDRIRSRELIGKYLKMFVDQVESIVTHDVAELRGRRSVSGC